MSACTVNITGTATGANCGTYPDSCNTTCCTGATYTGCGGSPSANCTSCTGATNCCNYTTPGCGGTNQSACTAGTQEACTSSPCCKWTAPSGPCQKKDCTTEVAQEYCATCGCTVTGGCSNKACNTLATEAICIECGCTREGNCGSTRTCAQVAALDNNPDVCAGCDTCGGDWDIDGARTGAWAITVTGETDVAAGGSLDMGANTLTTQTYSEVTSISFSGSIVLG